MKRVSPHVPQKLGPYGNRTLLNISFRVLSKGALPPTLLGERCHISRALVRGQLQATVAIPQPLVLNEYKAGHTLEPVRML
jgi:hypothetical protein